MTKASKAAQAIKMAEATKADVAKAKALGKAAFERGEPYACMADADLRAMLTKQPSVHNIERMKAWCDGWTAANVAAPLPE